MLVTSQDAEFQTLFKHVLESEGFVPLFTSDLRETLRIARKAKPDAVLLDCWPQALPYTDTCRRLKQSPQTAPIPVFAFVNPESECDDLRLQEAGVRASFFRPFARLGRSA